MYIIEGKTNYFYDDRAEEDVCKAHVLHILPHPEREDDRLIVYRWYGKHRQRWWYGVTTISQQELWADYVKKVIGYRKQKRSAGNAVSVATTWHTRKRMVRKTTTAIVPASA